MPLLCLFLGLLFFLFLNLGILSKMALSPWKGHFGENARKQNMFLGSSFVVDFRCSCCWCSRLLLWGIVALRGSCCFFIVSLSVWLLVNIGLTASCVVLSS